MRQRFLKQVGALREHLRTHVRPFALDGVTIAGQEYCALIKAYLGAINSGSVGGVVT